MRGVSDGFEEPATTTTHELEYGVPAPAGDPDAGHAVGSGQEPFQVCGDSGRYYTRRLDHIFLIN